MGGLYKKGEYVAKIWLGPMIDFEWQNFGRLVAIHELTEIDEIVTSLRGSHRTRVDVRYKRVRTLASVRTRLSRELTRL